MYYATTRAENDPRFARASPGSRASRESRSTSTPTAATGNAQHARRRDRRPRRRRAGHPGRRRQLSLRVDLRPVPGQTRLDRDPRPRGRRPQRQRRLRRRRRHRHRHLRQLGRRPADGLPRRPGRPFSTTEGRAPTATTACATSTRCGRPCSTAATPSPPTSRAASPRRSRRDAAGGTYIVEAAVPPGYEIVKEEDKNVDFGEATPPACAPAAGLRRRSTPGAGRAFAVPGRSRRPFAGQTAAPLRPQAGRPLQRAERRGRLLPLHRGAHGRPPVGFILNDLANEFDPNAPTFGEKYAPPGCRSRSGTDRDRDRPRLLRRVRGLQRARPVHLHRQPCRRRRHLAPTC